MKKVRMVLIRLKRFECFECGEEVLLPYHANECPVCGEEENFYLMN